MNPEKDPTAVLLGRKGGIAAAANMTKEQRTERARKAVRARKWRRPLVELGGKPEAVPCDGECNHDFCAAKQPEALSEEQESV